MGYGERSLLQGHIGPIDHAGLLPMLSRLLF